MYAEVAWVLVSLRTQVQPQVILDPDYLSVSYDYVYMYQANKVLEQDTDAYETDGIEDDIDFSTSDNENEKHSGTSNIPSPSVPTVLTFILGIRCDFDVHLTLSVQCSDT